MTVDMEFSNSSLEAVVQSRGSVLGLKIRKPIKKSMKGVLKWSRTYLKGGLKGKLAHTTPIFTD